MSRAKESQKWANWFPEFQPAEKRYIAEFSPESDSSIYCCGIELDEFKEDLSNQLASRIHKSQFDPLEYTVNTQAYIRDSEISINRKYNFSPYFIEVVADIRFKKTPQFYCFNFDSIVLPDSWDFVGMLKFSELSNQALWQEASANKKFHSSLPILSVFFKSPSGLLLQIGCGDDLWRWMIAKNFPDSKSLFSIEKKKKTWIFRRNIIKFSDKSIFSRKELRLSWFLKLIPHIQQENPALKKQKHRTLNLNLLECPENAKIAWKSSKSSFACPRSSWARKEMRKFIRSSLNNPEIKHLAILNPPFCLCDDSSHLGRNDSLLRPHWNVIEIEKFRKWASHTLSYANKDLVISPSSIEIPLLG